MSLDAALQGSPAVLFPVGLRSGLGKFLTVEKVQDQLNSNGKSLRLPQIWQFESDGQGKYAFKSWKGKYLSSGAASAANTNEQVTATAATAGPKEWFTIEWKSGIIAIKNLNNVVLGVDAGGQVVVGATGANAEWELVINYHPQVCLKTQSKYVSVDPKNGAVLNTKPTQFGMDTMLTMEPMDVDPMVLRGQWTLKGANGKFITIDPSNGNCTATADAKDANCALFFEFHGNNLVWKAIACGKYLASGGQNIKAIRGTVGTKEVFQLVDSDAQIALKAFNGKWVSFQGANLISNKTEVTNDEIFMLQYTPDAADPVKNEGRWSLRTNGEVYVSAKDGGAVSVDAKAISASEQFTFEFINGKVAIKTNAGKYLAAAKLGGVDAKGTDSSKDECQFQLLFSNRPQMVFLTNIGSFVGVTNDKVMANKSLPEQFNFVFKDGLYAVQTQGGKYLKIDGKSVVLSDSEFLFELEFHYNKLALKSGGKFVTIDTTAGTLTFGADTYNKLGQESVELFEF